ncbi:MAG: FAD binding domain-containing protein [Neisseriaceae bacterium]|nr:FAD binding domain-containing protein [Neisseriaceae bacterium]
MKPATFHYRRMASLADVTEQLAQHGSEARILAGGQSLMAALNMRFAQPEYLLDISTTPDLQTTCLDRQHLVIGAACTQASIEWRSTLAAEVPLLKLAFPYISHFQIRNRGTVCGSIAHADPSAELPLCLATLGGDVVLASAKNERILRADDFFIGVLTTAKREDECLKAVRFPLDDGNSGYAFHEFSRRHGDFAVAACAVVINDQGLRLGVGGLSDRPEVLSLSLSELDSVEDALNDFIWALDVNADAHASAPYRRNLMRALGRQAVADAQAQRAHLIAKE